MANPLAPIHLVCGFALAACAWIAPALAIDRIVNNTQVAGDGVCDTHCSLRDAIDAAVPGQDVVRFDPSVFSTPQIIGSGSGVFSIPFDKSLTVIGPGRDLLTLHNGTIRDVNPSSAHAYDIRGLTFYSSNGFWVRSGASARFEDVRFSAPDPFSDAAIWVQSGNLTVSMCEFVNISSFMNGGGISQDIGTLNVNNSSFKNSFAGDAGGIYTRAQNSSIIGNTFEGNSSFNHGGAIHVANAIKAEIGNNTFYGNASGGLGAAIFAEGSTSTLAAYNNTIINNIGSAAAIYSESPTVLALIANNIIALNIDGANAPLPAFGGSGLNVDHDNITSATNLNLGPLTDNGGLTRTMALLDGSSAIGVGDPTICNRAPINRIDQRGFTRHICDAGAYASTPEDVFADSFE